MIVYTKGLIMEFAVAYKVYQSPKLHWTSNPVYGTTKSICINIEGKHTDKTITMRFNEERNDKGLYKEKANEFFEAILKKLKNEHCQFVDVDKLYNEINNKE